MARNTDVVALAATNRVSAIDPALTRPGRFDAVIRIPLPDAAERRAILEVHSRSFPLGDDVDLVRIANQTEGLSGADLAALAQIAARQAAHRHLDDPSYAVRLRQSDFEQAASQIHQASEARLDDFIAKREHA